MNQRDVPDDVYAVLASATDGKGQYAAGNSCFATQRRERSVR